jgi:hypothetical protein
VLFHSLPTSERPLTHVAGEHGIVRWSVAMLLHRPLAAERLLAFGAQVGTAEGCVVSAGVLSQHVSGSEFLGAKWTLVLHCEEYLV